MISVRNTKMLLSKLKTNDVNETISYQGLKHAQVEYDYLLKFLLIGDPGVGKSCLLLRYTDDKYTGSYISTIGVDFRVKQIRVNEQNIKLQIWDTAGQERFRAMTSNYARSPDAVIVVFDLTDKLSFLKVEEHLDYHFSRKQNATIILVGAKSDLASQCVVSEDEVRKYIDETSNYTFDFYAETSAKRGDNVDNVFNIATLCSLNRLHPSKFPQKTAANHDHKESIISDLKRYIERIESHKTISNEIDFGKGFFIFKKSRAINRKANYLLSKQFLEKLENPICDIVSTFSDIEKDRNSIITANALVNEDYVHRGIKSCELNRIIRKAKI